MEQEVNILGGKKLYVVGYGKSYGHWLNHFGMTLTDSPKEADLVMWTGGEDIDPALYGEKQGFRTWFNPARDKYEVEAFEQLKDKPKIGICRGGQLLTALSGGKLIQHVSHHGQTHLMQTIDGRTMVTSSLHHQMMMPYSSKEPYELLAWSKGKISSCYLNGDDKESEEMKDRSGEYFCEPEIIYWPNTNSLCIQGHPEMMDISGIHHFIVEKLRTMI